jgi:L-2-hydroxyglutarate oxidase LhgO
MREVIDTVVIGAGLVGLAAARALARQGREVWVLEALDAAGSVTSARNSEVIHAGLYYPAGSLKARLCVEGRKALYAYCESRHIPHRRCGKWVVATETHQIEALELLRAQALGHGVDDLVLIDGAQARRTEPALHAVAALNSPSSGLVDSHALMLALRADAEADGALIALRSPVLAGHVEPGGIELEVGGAQPTRLLARRVINAAGLRAPSLAATFEGLSAAHVPVAHFCKGNYFSLAGKAPFQRLIYPVPEAAGLGVHLTLDLGGQARFGPDVEWLPDSAALRHGAAIDYQVSAARAERFYAQIRRYWPALPDGALQPAYSGVRPKTVGPGEPAADFTVSGPADHGVPGLVNLFGIESPGLTACLALGDAVVESLRASGG